MSWLLAVASVVAAGLALGQLKVRGVSLGVAGVLFAGLFAGHFGKQWGLAPDGPALETLRDLGLVLFVSAVGAQVGPGFIQSLRHGGLRFNALAASIVLLGALCTLGLSRALHLDMAALAGVFAGATTNTPSLGAVQQALESLHDVSAARRGLPGLGYAVAYPFGVIGVLAAIVGVRALFRIDVAAEVARADAQRLGRSAAVLRRAFVLTNENLEGMTVDALPGLRELRVIVSRVLA
jgi:putative transport protein